MARTGMAMFFPRRDSYRFFLVLFIPLVIFCVVVALLFAHFYRVPTKFVTIIHDKLEAYPDVTVCNVNPIRRSALKAFSEKYQSANRRRRRRAVARGVPTALYRVGAAEPGEAKEGGYYTNDYNRFKRQVVCPPNYTWGPSPTGKCYMDTLESGSAVQAYVYCLERGAKVVTPQTWEEFLWINGKITIQNAGYWLGELLVGVFGGAEFAPVNFDECSDLHSYYRNRSFYTRRYACVKMRVGYELLYGLCDGPGYFICERQGSQRFGPAANSCPADFPITTLSGGCLVEQGVMNLDTAIATCRSLGAHLPRIRNPTDMFHLAGISSGGVWLDYYRAGNAPDGTFVFTEMSTGEKIDVKKGDQFFLQFDATSNEGRELLTQVVGPTGVFAYILKNRTDALITYCEKDVQLTTFDDHDVTMNCSEVDDLGTEDNMITDMLNFIQAGFASEGLAGTMMAHRQLSQLLAVVPENERQLMGMDLRKMVASCIINGVPCRKSDLVKTKTWFDNIQGNCITFSTFDETNKTTSHRMRNYRLELVLDVDEGEYLTSTTSAGHKIMITNHNEAVIPEFNGKNVSPGKTTFRVFSTKIRYLKNCISAVNPQDYFYSGVYTVRGCEATDLQKVVTETCGCGHTGFAKPADIPECSVAEFNCTQAAFQISRQSPSKCQKPCVSAELSVESSSWNEKRDGAIKRKDNNETEVIRWVKAEIQVEPMFIEHREILAYPLPCLLSNIGGLMGVLMGFSAIMWVHFGYVVYRIIFKLFDAKRKKREHEIKKRKKNKKEKNEKGIG